MFKVFAPKKLKFKPGEYMQYDKGTTVKLPDVTKAKFCSLDRKVVDINQKEKQIYFSLINKKFVRTLEIKKNLKK